MPREERAKQFMPFDALKGFREALREVEAQVERERIAEGKGEPMDFEV